MPARRHDSGMAHRDPGHMLDRDRLRVVAQQIRRNTADMAQRRVQTRDQRAHRLIPDRDHHPEPRPGKPRAEQVRLATVHPRPVAPVELQPQPRLSHPRSIRAPPTRPPCCLRRPHRPPGGAFRPRKSHRHKAFVHSVCPDLPLRRVDQLLHLGQERVDQLRSRSPRPHERIPATGITQCHIPLHRLCITPGQLRRRMRAASQVVRLQDLHDLPVRLGHGLSGLVGCKVSNQQPTNRRDPLHVAETEIT